MVVDESAHKVRTSLLMSDGTSWFMSWDIVVDKMWNNSIKESWDSVVEELRQY